MNRMGAKIITMISDRLSAAKGRGLSEEETFHQAMDWTKEASLDVSGRIREEYREKYREGVFWQKWWLS